MKNRTYAFILFFTLALNSVTFTMNKDNSISISKGNSAILNTLVFTDLFSGAKGSWVRTLGTVFGVSCALGIDEKLRQEGTINSSPLTNLAVAAVVGVHASRIVSYFSQGNEQRNSNNIVDQLQTRVTVLEQQNRELQNFVQIIYQQNQAVPVAQQIPQQNQ